MPAALTGTVINKAIIIPKGTKIASVLSKLSAEKKAAFDFQKRRHAQWDENYLLYRDKVTVNRLTQRHAVNVPIIKETIRTNLPKIDEAPDIAFEDKAGDLDREIVVNAKWQDDFDTCNLELIDYVDKKQVFLYGRSYKKLNWINGVFSTELKDVYDLLLDPKASPLDIETARYLVEPHIYRPLEEILANEKYDKEGRNKLQALYSNDGKKGKLNQSKANKEMAEAREKRMQQLGKASNIMDDFSAYDTIEELTQHYTQLWDKDAKKFTRYVILVAGDDIILRAEPLKQAIGVEFWPFEGWADDIENTDIWSDSIADMLRTPNQIINVWTSQLLENRTLRNFGMNFYDSTVEGFNPSTFVPKPGGWYPLPGKPGEVYQRVDIPDLSGSINDIQFFINIAEKASATGAIDKGVVEQGKRTLGEIEIAVSKATERTTSMAKFYRLSWKRYAGKWYALHEANMPEGAGTTLYKKNPEGKLVGKKITRKELVSPDGMRVVANSANQRVGDKVESIQRLMAVKQQFPDNKALNKAIQKRMITLADLTPEEAQEIEAEEAQKIGGGAPMDGSAPAAPGGAAPAGKPAQQNERLNVSINFKDLPPEGQRQAAALAGIQLAESAPAPMQAPAIPGM